MMGGKVQWEGAHVNKQEMIYRIVEKIAQKHLSKGKVQQLSKIHKNVFRKMVFAS